MDVLNANSPEQQLFARFGLTYSQVEQVLAIAGQGLAGFGFGELFFEQGVTEVVTLDHGVIRGIDFFEVNGCGIRVVVGERTGFRSTADTTFATLCTMAREAREAALFGSGTLPPVSYSKPQSKQHDLYSSAGGLMNVGLAQKIKLCRDTDAVARSVNPAAIINCTVSAIVEEQAVIIANTLGQLVYDLRPMVRFNVHTLAEQNGRREMGYAAGGGRRSFDSFYQDDAWSKMADRASRQALAKMEAVDAPTGEMTIVMGPGWPAVIIHEAVGHPLEGDANLTGGSAFARLIGQRVASSECTIVDDGTLAERRGSLNVDDEGRPTGCTTLIEKGILKQYMQDSRCAALMGAAPTGNGRRQSYAYAPIPRMTNTRLLNGPHSPGDIIASVEDGIYTSDFSGGMVNSATGSFTFSASVAHRIRGGKLAEMVRGVTLIGNGARALLDVEMVGNDGELDAGIAICGKDGQSVPVGVGQPTLKIRNVTVGGTSN